MMPFVQPNISNRLKIVRCITWRYLIDFHSFLQMSEFLLRSNVNIEFDDLENIALDKLNNTPTVKDYNIEHLRN